MRHPFDGILPARDQQPTGSSRREALQWLVGGSAAALAMQLSHQALAEDPVLAAEDTSEPAKPVGEYRLYYIVPATDAKAFLARRRAELTIQGAYLPGLPGNEELKEKPGFLAWWDKDLASAASAADDVASLRRIEPEDVDVNGAPPEKGPATLRVLAAPFDWNAMPEEKTYEDIDAMRRAWEKQFGMHPNVKIVANKNIRTPYVVFEDGKVPESVIDAIKSHPQVYALQWMTPVAATTLRVGEEAATTQALGEEGATTGALREEAATTKAIGEEGGPRPSTRALGEEGGRPRPQPTTLAIGEEGGKITTQAIGEEGGR